MQPRSGRGLQGLAESRCVVLTGAGRIQIRVDGIPVPQGSKQENPYGRGVRDANAERLHPWRRHVTAVARDQCRYHDCLTGPVKAWIRFTFERPKAHYRTGRNAHRLRDGAPLMPTGHDLGDIDKLVRAIFDSLEAAGVVADDCLFVDLRTRKVYAGEDEHALDHAGVVIVLEPLTTEATVPVLEGEAGAGTVQTTQEVLL